MGVVAGGVKEWWECRVMCWQRGQPNSPCVEVIVLGVACMHHGVPFIKGALLYFWRGKDVPSYCTGIPTSGSCLLFFHCTDKAALQLSKFTISTLALIDSFSAASFRTSSGTCWRTKRFTPAAAALG